MENNTRTRANLEDEDTDCDEQNLAEIENDDVEQVIWKLYSRYSYTLK